VSGLIEQPWPYAIALDVGQQIDYSAVSIVRRVESRYEIVWLERYQLGTAFHSVVARVAALRNAPEVERRTIVHHDDGRRTQRVEKPAVVIDATGVGAPLIELGFQERTPENVR
jgi:hypothetical protein